MFLKTSVPRGWFYALFAFSGFAGLVYESVWSHYLKLFLGHAAYAQTLVLVILMGGMALGAWLCSLRTHRWRNLLLGYAAAELAIGATAVVFHPLFLAATDFAHDAAIPLLGSPLAVGTFKWLLSAVLILPQSMLLGMTFPLMSAGVMRAYPDRSGGTIAMLYFTNSFGAALGVLASGFFLIRAIGLPGTVLTAGLLNIVIALLVWLLAKDLPQDTPPSREADTAASAATVAQPAAISRSGYRLMLAISLLTGAASFMYEIGWIRMLSMVLGSSTHAFELMLSAFIFGLAFGGLWIKRRMGGSRGPEVVLGIVQVAMGVLALGTLLVYGQVFELMRVLLDTVARTERGYAAFNLGSHLIALLVMFPAAFCAGMTLPLITHALLTRGAGERAIGAVYAANTVGAITGVIVATHLAMPALGLKALIVLGAAIDIGLGLLLLWRYASRGMPPVLAGAVGGACIAGTLAWVELDSLKMASGVYRTGLLFRTGDAEVVFHRDGRTATVNLVREGGKLSIVTNGKSDTKFDLTPGAEVGGDELANILLGALPVLLHPEARTAAVIGIGSGITSHVLLGSDRLRELDTIEIEPAMVEAARGFMPRNAAVFNDPRSRIHIEDAKTFFSAHGKRYDLIVSEPSNPWVSGVASLFSDEFYRRIRRHLNEGGLFVQWLQLYEIEPALVASVINALARNFPQYELYTSEGSNLLVVARDGGPVPPVAETAFAYPRLAAALARMQIHRGADLEPFRIGSRRPLHPYFAQFGGGWNSDFFPILDQNAARARFMGASAPEVVELGWMPVPAIDFLGGVPRQEYLAPRRAWLRRSDLTHFAQRQKAYLLGGDELQLDGVPAALRRDSQLLRLLLVDCPMPRRKVSVDQIYSVAESMLPHLARGESQAVWKMLRASRCTPGEPQARWLELFAAVDARDAAAMARVAEGLIQESDLSPGSHADYLLGAAIVGRLANGEREAATQLWRKFSSRVRGKDSTALPDFLRGHLLAGPTVSTGDKYGPQ